MRALRIVMVLALVTQMTYALSEEISEQGIKIEIEQEWKGYYCGYAKAARLVIKTKEQWREIWEKVYSVELSKPELPMVDFEKEMVVAVFMGECPTGGYEIEIINIIKTEKEIIVEVQEKEPRLDSLRTMALTQPYHIVVIKSFPLSVRFQRP